jgi:hypothetical protein
MNIGAPLRAVSFFRLGEGLARGAGTPYSYGNMMLGEEKVVEKLVHVPGDVFVGITAGQLERAASMLEELAVGIWKLLNVMQERPEAMMVEAVAFEWVVEALRKVRGIVESEGTNQ